MFLKRFLDFSALSAKWLVRLMRKGLLIFMLFWMVLSHTVGWAADLTSAILRTGFAVTSTTALAQSDAKTAHARLTELETDLTRERSTSARLTADLDRSSARAIQLNQSLVESQARLESRRGAFERANSELFASRREITQLRGQLATASGEVARLNRLHPQTVRLRGQEVPTRTAITSTLESVQARTIRVTKANVASIAGESFPFYGIAIVVAATTIEVAAACANMNDLYDLQVALDPESAVPSNRDEVCGLQVPTGEEVWDGIRNSPRAVWETSVQAVETASSGVTSFQIPEFSSAFDVTIAWFGSWID